MDSKDIYRHGDSYDNMQDSIVTVLDSDLKQAIVRSPFVGLMADETSDICVNKKLIIYVRLIENGSAITKYACNIKVKDGTAETIFMKIVNFCKEMDISSNKIAGLGTDGAACMLGEVSGVGVRIQQLNKCIIVVHCVAHRLALASSGAAKSIVYLVKLQSIINSIYAFFSCSVVRYEKLIKTSGKSEGEISRYFLRFINMFRCYIESTKNSL